MSADRTYRLWRQAGLQVPKTTAAPARGDQPPAAAAADGDQSRLGVRLRLRHVRRRPHAEVPDGHRRVHAGVPGDRRRRRHSIGPRDRGADAARERARRARATSAPTTARSSWRRAILRWLQTAQIETAFIDPGKPWQNGTDESFNGKFRERASVAAVVPESRSRPRSASSSGGGTTTRCGRTSSLGYLTPAEFKAQDQEPERLFKRGPKRRCSPVAIGPKKPGRSDPRCLRSSASAAYCRRVRRERKERRCESQPDLALGLRLRLTLCSAYAAATMKMSPYRIIFLTCSLSAIVS